MESSDRRHVEEGWYDYGIDGKRYWDGEHWTDNYAYVPKPMRQWNRLAEIASAVALGVLDRVVSHLA